MSRRRGSVKRLAKNKYAVRVFLGTDDNGKRVYAQETIEGTNNDAQKAITRLLANRDTQSFVKPSEHTLRTFSHVWKKVKTDVEERTLDSYWYCVEKNIHASKLADKRLADLSPLDIQEWVAWMRDERGLGPRSIRYAFTVMGMILSEAVRLHLLRSNVALGTKLPKKAHTEMEVLSPSELGTFLEVNAEDPLFPLWDLLFASGLRPGEALALTAQDFDGRRITVNKALDNKGRVKDTKTGRSRRTVSLPEVTCQTLKAHIRRHGLVGKAILFPSEAGTYQDLCNIRKRFIRALKRAKVKPIRLYDTRHTHATHLLMAGVALKVVSERLGHSSVAVTGDVYSHVLPEMDDSAAEKAASLVARKLETPATC